MGLKAKRFNASGRLTWLEWTFEHVEQSEEPLHVHDIRKAARNRSRNEGLRGSWLTAEAQADASLYKLVKQGRIIRLKRGVYASMRVAKKPEQQRMVAKIKKLRFHNAEVEKLREELRKTRP